MTQGQAPAPAAWEAQRCTLNIKAGRARSLVSHFLGIGHPPMPNQAGLKEASADVSLGPAAANDSDPPPHTQALLILASSSTNTKLPFPPVGPCSSDEAGMMRLVHFGHKLLPAVTELHGLRGNICSRVYALKVE